MKSRQTLLFLFIFFVCTGWTQQHHYYQLSVANGLPSNEVYCVEQDALGFLWIGTNMGLYRYDGRFYQEIVQEQRGGAISNVQIIDGKTIYCQNFSGQIYRCSLFDDRLELIFDAEKISGKFPDFTVQSSNDVFVLTDLAIYQIQPNKKPKIILKPEDLTSSFGNFLSIETLDEQHITLVNYAGAMINYNISTNTWREIKTNHKTGDLFKLFRSNQGVFLLQESNEASSKFNTLFRVTQTSIKPVFERLVLPQEAAILQVESRDEGLFLLSTAGYHIWNIQKQCITKSELTNRSISYMFDDKEHNRILTSLRSGIFIMPNQNLEVFAFPEPYTTIDVASAIAESSDGNGWIGTHQGRIFSFKNQTSLLWDEPRQKRGAVRKIIEYNEALFVARGEFDIVDRNGTETVAALRNTRDFIITNDTIYAITNDRCVAVNKSKGKWNSTILRKKGAKSIVALNDKLYVLFVDGFFELSRGRWKEIHYQQKSIYGQKLLVHQNALYLATQKHGLCRWQNGRLKTDLLQLTNAADKFIHAITTFNRDVLVATPVGFYRFHTQSASTETIHALSGVHLPDIHQMQNLKQKLWICSSEGMHTLSFSEKTTTIPAPSAQFLHFMVDDVHISGKTKQIDLPHTFTNLTVGIRGASIRSRDGLRFAYRISPINKNWVNISGLNTAVVINQLPPGDYQLQLKSIAQNGQESAVQIVQLHIAEPIWQKWWFYLLLLIALFTITLYLFKKRIEYIQNQKNREVELLRAKMTALKSQMNPHFMFNALNSIQDLILEKDFKKTNEALNTFANMLRKTLDYSEKDVISLEQEIDLLQSYLSLESLRFEDNFNYELTIDPALIETNPVLPPLFIQPYIENAIKHGLLHKKGSKRVAIHFRDEQTTFLCIIEDNGIGRLASQEINKNRTTHNPFAMRANEQRTDILQHLDRTVKEVNVADLHENGVATGTRVSIVFNKTEVE